MVRRLLFITPITCSHRRPVAPEVRPLNTQYLRDLFSL